MMNRTSSKKRGTTNNDTEKQSGRHKKEEKSPWRAMPWIPQHVHHPFHPRLFLYAHHHRHESHPLHRHLYPLHQDPLEATTLLAVRMPTEEDHDTPGHQKKTILILREPCQYFSDCHKRETMQEKEESRNAKQK